MRFRFPIVIIDEDFRSENASGLGSVGWMLALAAMMAAEKNLPFGRRLRTPIGLALLAGAAGVLLASN